MPAISFQRQFLDALLLGTKQQTTRKQTDRIKAHLSQEEYLDEEFRLMHVEPHITHLKQPEDCYYSAVTVASRDEVFFRNALAVCYAEAYESKNAKHKLGERIINAFRERDCGVALCHHLDQFNRKRGRIIAKGRLFKLMRKEGLR